MIYLLVLLPATALTIGGYLALVLSARTEGALRTFGKYLGFWAFTLAGLLILGTIFAAAHGPRHCPFFGMHGMQGHMYCPESRSDEPRVGSPPPEEHPAPAESH